MHAKNINMNRQDSKGAPEPSRGTSKQFNTRAWVATKCAECRLVLFIQDHCQRRRLDQNLIYRYCCPAKRPCNTREEARINRCGTRSLPLPRANS